MSQSRKRMVVTGRQGQVVLSLLARGQSNGIFDIVALGRPELDLHDHDRIQGALQAAQPDVIVSAAAYTAVDQAETEEATVISVNGIAAGRIAASAHALGVPVIHISTDYVFDGRKPLPYVEVDRLAPVGAYGRSKLAGEMAVAEAATDYTILRTSWVYSPFGKNFVKTMLRFAESRERLDVVDDQIGNPTSALDIADGILKIASSLLSSDDPALRGIFHMAGSGDASWADFASEIFNQSKLHGMPTATVGRIPSSQYPTLAKRPANSRLDCSKLERIHGVKLREWKSATAETLAWLAELKIQG